MKTAVFLAAAVAYALWKLVARLGPEPEFDAKHTYIPFAQKLLADPLAFLASEQSMWVGPFAYFYPALFGAEPMRIKVANVVLFVVLIFVVFRIGSLLHSRAAGIACALLLAASPALKIFFPTALTEPPFLFLTGIWIWALCEGHRSGQGRWWVLSGLALGLAILTRPTYLYFAPLAIAAGVFVWWRSRWTLPHRDARGIAVAHAVALAIVALVILRNALLFGYPSVATGAGAALFLGSNPMTDGYDAAYMGLLLDDGAVHGGKGHLTIEGDRLLRGVAATALADLPLADIASMYATKLGAFLFVTQAETLGVPEILRAWRIALLVLGIYGLFHIRVPALRLLLAGALAYQVAVHVPALYTYRYSVDALDVPLTIAAGVGIAHAIGEQRRRLAALAAALVAAVALGWAAGHFMDPASPHIDRVPHARFWKGSYNPPLLARAGEPLDIEVKDAPGLHPWDNSVLDVFAAPTGGACRSFAASYRRRGEAQFVGSVVRRLDAGPQPRLYSIGSRLPLELYAEGTLRITADCGAGGAMAIHGIRIATGRFATFYADRLMGRPRLKGTIDPRSP